MGNYPVLPAKVLETGEELHKLLDANKEKLIGKHCLQKFDGVLPFLPKVGLEIYSIAGRTKLLIFRYSQLPRPCRSKSIRTRTWQLVCITRTQRSSPTITTNLKSPQRLGNSGCLVGGNLTMTSNPCLTL